MARNEPLEFVSFERPPVAEVAFAVQFVDPVLAFDELGALRREMSRDFPVTQLQPALPRIQASEGMLLQLRTAAMPRLWFTASDGHRVVQAQEDRLALNWRRLGRPVDYPRYGPLRNEFLRLLGLVRTLVGTHATIDVCELTYVNELSRGDDAVTGSHPPLSRFLRTVGAYDFRGFLADPGSEEWVGNWPIRKPDGAQGSLAAKVDPVFTNDGQPLYLLTMTCQLADGRPMQDDQAQLAMDTAHEWIVRGFADITTPEMHERWGRTK